MFPHLDNIATIKAATFREGLDEAARQRLAAQAVASRGRPVGVWRSAVARAIAAFGRFVLGKGQTLPVAPGPSPEVGPARPA